MSALCSCNSTSGVFTAYIRESGSRCPVNYFDNHRYLPASDIFSPMENSSGILSIIITKMVLQSNATSVKEAKIVHLKKIVCCAGAGTEMTPGKGDTEGFEMTPGKGDTEGFTLQEDLAIVNEVRGFKGLDPPRNNHRTVQSSLFLLQGWQVNCVIQLILYNVDQDFSGLKKLQK
jgi:hypothetical protein